MRPDPSARLRRSISLAGLGLGTLLLAACSAQTTRPTTGDAAPPNFLPGEVVTQQGRLSAELYPIIFVIAVAVFLLVEGSIIYIAFRYRRRPTDRDLPVQTHGHNLLEIAWTLIPAVIVTGLFVLAMSVLFRIEARAADPDVEVDVTGFQWQWTFDYPEEDLSFTGAGVEGPEMVLPVGETVRIRLHSQDVIHSFYVPQFFFKRDVVPGRVNEFDVLVERPGTYGGQCAEFCGLAHADMYFTVRAVPRAEYDTWVADEQARANATPTPAPPSGPPQSGGPPPAGTVVETATTPDAPLAFAQTMLQAPAGAEVTVNYLNDSSVPHNIAFFQGADATAPRIAATEVMAGPGNQQTVSFTAPAEPGSYFFHCDVHAQQMTGTFEVTP